MRQRIEDAMSTTRVKATLTSLARVLTSLYLWSRFRSPFFWVVYLNPFSFDGPGPVLDLVVGSFRRPSRGSAP
jgi:hypothetical protein